MNSPSQSLWPQIVSTTEQALESGALQTIATKLQFISDANLKFCVRILDNLNRKEAAKKSSPRHKGPKPFNPFLPYEEDLFVTHLSETHICLLNKYNVVDHHILIVTREYESQDSWLTYADFAALVRCLIEIDGFGFYNGGPQAGASQHHKHLQLVPFTSQAGILELPITTLVNAEKELLQSSIHLSSLPFWHAVQPIHLQWTEDAFIETSQQLFAIFQQLMVTAGMELNTPKPAVPYNLLVTREWIMIVLRSQESYQGIGVNSLGYSGWLLVKNLEDLERLKQIGPMALLQTVGKPLTKDL